MNRSLPQTHEYNQRVPTSYTTFHILKRRSFMMASYHMLNGIHIHTKYENLNSIVTSFTSILIDHKNDHMLFDLLTTMTQGNFQQQVMFI